MDAPASNAALRTKPSGSRRRRWPTCSKPRRRMSPSTSGRSSPRANWSRPQPVRITYKFEQKAAVKSRVCSRLLPAVFLRYAPILSKNAHLETNSPHGLIRTLSRAARGQGCCSSRSALPCFWFCLDQRTILANVSFTCSPLDTPATASGGVIFLNDEHRTSISTRRDLHRRIPHLSRGFFNPQKVPVLGTFFLPFTSNASILK